MADISPYRRLPRGDINERLGRWLEELRRKVNQAGNNIDAGNIGDSLYLVRSDDLVRASSIVPLADPDFAITLAVNAAWALEGVLKFTAGAGGIRFNLSGPIDGNFHWNVTDPGTSLTTEDNNGMLDDVTVAVISGSMAVELSGVFRTGAVAVPFNMSWAQETSDVTGLQLDQGSWLRITRVTDAQITPPAPVVLTILPASL